MAQVMQLPYLNCVKQFLPRIALMLGNFATGVSILAPAGMLTVLADGLGVGIRDTGLLVTYGAVILCFGSPLLAWLTTRFDRRLLLAGTLAVLVAGQAASAFAPNYAIVLALRLAMLTVAAIYTPQAASTVAMIVPAGKRASAIAFVFLGWSLAVAGGLPMITFVAAYAGWRAAFGAAALAAMVPCLLLAFTLPGGLRGPPLSLASFGIIARHRKILLLLLITILQTSGQFTVFIYLSPLLMRLTGADHNVVGTIFAIYGVAGFAGNVIATRIVSALGGWITSVVFLGSTFAGMLLWALGAGFLPVMGIGIVFWGLGFAATNSMQQARLVEAAPDLSSATVGLNTSALYTGQAIGSAIGGILFSQGYLHSIGYVGVTFVALGIAVWAITRDGSTGRGPAAAAQRADIAEAA
jgi:DHA1 family inner membrane transport protein